MFALVDCNNFFASCEEVFNPNLKKKALLILSNNDGCVIARSKKAKEIGVKMGEPAYLYKGRKDLQMLSSNFPLYSDMSARVMETLATCVDDIEIYSIDEAFLHFDGDPKKIREKIGKWTGIPVSIGMGFTKTQAKLASEMAKKEKEGCFTFHEKILEITPVSDIWGIGSKCALRLQRIKIYSAKDFARASPSLIQKELGIVGVRIFRELNGEPVFHLNEEPEKKKSIVCSRTFGKRPDAIEPLEEAVAYFAARAAEKLRGQDSLASFLSVFLMEDRFETSSSFVSLPVPTSYTPDFIAAAKTCLKTLFKGGKNYRKAGVVLGDFCDVSSQELDLFAPPPSPKKEAAMRLLDKVNQKFEKNALQFASEGTDQKWKPFKKNLSPKYTTSWKELMKVY